MMKNMKRYILLCSVLIMFQLISCSGFSIYKYLLSHNVIEFGNVDIESYSDIDFVITNDDGSDGKITEITITGFDAQDFEIVSPTTLPTKDNPLIAPKNKGTATITVRFNATNPVGNRFGYLNVMYGRYLIIVTLRAHAEPIPIFNIDNISHDYGNVSKGGDKPFDFTVTNTGGKDMQITGLSITGVNASEFAVSFPSPLPDGNNPYIVMKDGGSSIVTANFQPIAPLTKKYGTLVIEHNAIGSPMEIPLEGLTVKCSTLANGVDNPRIFDPKLDGADELEFSYILGDNGVESVMNISVKKGAANAKTLFEGNLIGKTAPYTIKWDGKDTNGKFVDPGAYVIHIEALAGNLAELDIPIDIIRLGISKVAAVDNGGDNEYQMVYYMRGTAQQFTQTPTTGEFSMAKSTAGVSDLDNDDGTPKTPSAVHTDLKSYPMDGYDIEQYNHNLPVCYIRGTTPKFEVTLGATATSNINSTSKTCNYPVSGFDIRTICKDTGVEIATTGDEDNEPGEKITYTATDALPNYVDDFTFSIDWTWQYKPNGGATWIDIPGKFSFEYKIYTLYAEPYFPSTGTQYAPWVKTVDDVVRWCGAHVTGDVDTIDELYTAIDKGFFLDAGSNGTGLYCYDCNPGSGATHYVNYTTSALNLSGFYRLTNGKRINCTDCATLSCCIYNMMGATNVQRVRLGSMTLNAIEGIGWQQFTLSLWGTSHGFSYHHVCTTATNMEYILDDCMNLDIDGDPLTLPGTRGWNNPRIWTGTMGYDYLSARNTVTRSLDGKHTAIN